MAKRKENISIVPILVAGDVLMISGSFLFAYWLRFFSHLIPVHLGIPFFKEYVHALPYINIIILLILRSYGLYVPKKRISRVDEFFVIVKAVALATFVFMAITFIYREFSYSRAVLFLNSFISILCLAAFRFFIDSLIIRAKKRRGENRKLLILGTGEVGRHIAEHIQMNPRWGYELVGFVSLDPLEKKSLTGLESNETARDVSGVPVLGGADDFSNIVSRVQPDEVILTLPHFSAEKLTRIIIACEKEMISFKVVADLLSMVTNQVDVENIDGIPLIGLKETPLNQFGNRFLKRAMDISISFLSLLVLSPLFVVIGLIVKKGSPGPVFYRQERIGEDGREFPIYKFRTMIINAERLTGPVWAKKDDPRRTGIGRALRRYNLDELPQLINVLKGQMSLVGPRPERPHFVDRFKEDVPRYMARHRIKSGITGWAQVNGLRGDTSIEERTRYDLYYVENWSPSFDLKILFMSLFALKNAY